MDSFQFDFDTDSAMTNDTNSNSTDLDWSAFQSAPPAMSNGPFSPIWFAQQDDAVAPDNRTNLINSDGHDDGLYSEIEHFFNGLNQANPPPLPVMPISLSEQEQDHLQPMHVNLPANHSETTDFETTQRIHHQTPPMRNDRTANESCFTAPVTSRLSSSRSQCYHKLPDHAVKLMQEWYNANLDDPYPRSPDKKRFITEGNITAQQCRSWFANRRQRLKHVKRNHPRASSSNSFSSSSSSPTSFFSSSPSISSSLTTSSRLHQGTQARVPTRPSPTHEEPLKIHEHCYYCQQPNQPTSAPLTFTSTPTATTLHVVINQQTVEELIHNSLRKLLYPTVI